MSVAFGLVNGAAPDGGNDVAAAAMLALALMPGACTLVNRLRTLGPEIDQIVAGKLWLEVRTFPWRRLTKVSANIMLNARAGVLQERGAGATMLAVAIGGARRRWAAPNGGNFRSQP